MNKTLVASTGPLTGLHGIRFTAPATGSDTFGIALRNDPGHDSANNLVDIESAITGPASIAVPGAGLSGLGAIRRRCDQPGPPDISTL